MLLASSALTLWFLSEHSGWTAGRTYSGKMLASVEGTWETQATHACRARTARTRTDANGSDSITIFQNIKLFFTSNFELSSAFSLTTYGRILSRIVSLET